MQSGRLVLGGREAKRQKLEELQAQLQTLEGDMSLVVNQLEGTPTPNGAAASGAFRGNGPLPPLSAELLRARLMEASGDEWSAEDGGAHSENTPPIFCRWMLRHRHSCNEQPCLKLCIASLMLGWELRAAALRPATWSLMSSNCTLKV